MTCWKQCWLQIIRYLIFNFLSWITSYPEAQLKEVLFTWEIMDTSKWPMRVLMQTTWSDQRSRTGEVELLCLVSVISLQSGLRLTALWQVCVNHKMADKICKVVRHMLDKQIRLKELDFRPYRSEDGKGTKRTLRNRFWRGHSTVHL